MYPSACPAYHISCQRKFYLGPGLHLEQRLELEARELDSREPEAGFQRLEQEINILSVVR